jgi:hypothetical protein
MNAISVICFRIGDICVVGGDHRSVWENSIAGTPVIVVVVGLVIDRLLVGFSTQIRHAETGSGGAVSPRVSAADVPGNFETKRTRRSPPSSDDFCF